MSLFRSAIMAVVICGLASLANAADIPSDDHYISITHAERAPGSPTHFSWGGYADAITNSTNVQRKTWYREAGTTTWLVATVLTAPNGGSYIWQATNFYGVSPTGDIELRAQVRWYINGQWYVNEDTATFYDD